MTRQLHRAFTNLDLVKKNNDLVIPAVLGFLIGGQQIVEVPDRAGYVYARIRSNLNEVVQVFNDKVSPVYDMPVLLVRDPNQPNRYKVDARDTGRYENWITTSAYLPRHGAQHSFLPEFGNGGDVTWVASRQFLPLALLPSGSSGAAQLYIWGGPLLGDNGWMYAGATGTSSLLTYLPTGSSARMVLIYLDGNGNPQTSAGSLFDASSTGTGYLMAQVPSPPAGATPLGAVRLVSGTTTITWDNMYDLRPFFSGGGGSSEAAAIDVYEGGSLQVSDATALHFLGDGVDITASGTHAYIEVASSGGSGTFGNGWAIADDMTYSSADAPTFLMTCSGDQTDKYSAGMRIKLTQTTVKYFIITAVSYSAPDTTLTLYGGTDYTLTNAAITNPYYSMFKVPHGFPVSPTKWIVETTDVTTRTQTSPASGTWYNMGSVNISIPIGCWDVWYGVQIGLSDASQTSWSGFVTLSTGSSSESDPDLTSRTLSHPNFALSTRMTSQKTLFLESKTVYYINTKTSSNGLDNIFNSNDQCKLIIRATCSYL